MLKVDRESATQQTVKLAPISRSQPPILLSNLPARTRYRDFGALVSLALLITGCAPATDAPAHTSAGQPPARTETTITASQRLATDVDRLLDLIRQRLDVMPGVARAKWNRKLAITDPKREAALLTKLTAEGTALDLPEAFVRQFFQAQITASKLVQEQLFEDWKSQGQATFAEAPDLERDVRPQIDALNRQLLETLAKCQPERSKPNWTARLEQARRATFESTAWSDKVIQAALLPLQ